MATLVSTNVFNTTTKAICNNNMKNLPKKQMARLKKKILKMAQSGKNINDFKIAIEENAVYFLDNDICKHLSHSGETLLHRAVLSDNIDIVKYLVNEKHMDVNERNDQMKTPLHIAATHNSIQSIKFLLNEGLANPGAVRTFSWTPLMYAASRGHIDIVKILVNANVNIEDVNKENMTALYLASREGWYDVVVYLIKCGANVNIASGTTNRTPLFCALMNDHHEIVKYLIHNTNIDIEGRDSSMNTIWHEIAACNSLNSFKFFVDKNNVSRIKSLIDVNCKNNIDQHPIHLAAAEGHSEILKCMLNINNELINIKQRDGNSPLHLACCRGHINVVSTLIDFKCDVNAKGSNNRTALTLAMGFKNNQIAQLLLDNGAISTNNYHNIKII